jgi:hypothetical protein
MLDTRRTTYPMPFPDGSFNDPQMTWDEHRSARATSYWQVVDDHYRSMGWLERSFLYCFDEPTWPKNNNTVSEQEQLVISQSNSMYATGDPPIRAMVVLGDLDTTIANQGHVGIWVPNVTTFKSPAEQAAQYQQEKAKGARVWWYDSNQSRFTVNGQGAVFPDQFIDHPGVNQLARGPLTYVYGLSGYLYFDSAYNYATRGVGVWENNYADDLGTNGDGTLFYPGTPAIIGGPDGSDIPVPSIRLQLMRQSISTYDLLMLLRQNDQAKADQIAAQLVTDAQNWSKDATAYEAAREQIAEALLQAASTQQSVSSVVIRAIGWEIYLRDLTSPSGRLLAYLHEDGGVTVMPPGTGTTETANNLERPLAELATKIESFIQSLRRYGS